ncbi:hypothetical protein CAEBREN_08796 [Caenorhabditis brenneri]|uniref:Uncharacterized protein n=1 Tax=Caenorhabditis brenneri TaxID=135651 RepID=G0M7H4_CAEBE|nr:hypothetical protein CAEBREN_08796 [Caenorhabditis brenneri]
MPLPAVYVITERMKLYGDEFRRMLEFHYSEEEIRKFTESSGLSPKDSALQAIQNWYEHSHLVLYVNHFLEDTEVAPVPLGPDGINRQIVSKVKSPNEIEHEEKMKLYDSEFLKKINLVYSNEEIKGIQRNREISRLIDPSDIGTALYYIQTYYEHPHIVFFANHFLEDKEMVIVLQSHESGLRYVVLPQNQVAPVPKNADGTDRQIVIPPDCPKINKFREEMMAHGLRMWGSVRSPYRKETITRMYADYEVAHPAYSSALGFILLQIQLFYENPNIILMMNSHSEATGITIELKGNESRFEYLVLPQKAFGLKILEDIDVVFGKKEAMELYKLCDLVYPAEHLPIWIAHIHAKIFYENPAMVCYTNHYLRKMEIRITMTRDGDARPRYLVENWHNNTYELVEVPKNGDGTDRKINNRPVEGLIENVNLLKRKYHCVEMLERIKQKGFTTKTIKEIYRCSNLTDDSDPTENVQCPREFAIWMIHNFYDHPSIVHFANNFLEGSEYSIGLIRPEDLDRFHYVLRPENTIVPFINPDGKPSMLDVNPHEEFANEMAPIPVRADGTEYEIFECDRLAESLKNIYPKDPFF